MIGRDQRTAANGQNMRGFEMVRRFADGGAPVGERLSLKRGRAFIAAWKIGQDAVDSSPIETAHHLDDLSTQLVVLVEQRRKDQQTRSPSLLEGQHKFLASPVIAQGRVPACVHAVSAQPWTALASAKARRPP